MIKPHLCLHPVLLPQSGSSPLRMSVLGKEELAMWPPNSLSALLFNDIIFPEDISPVLHKQQVQRTQSSWTVDYKGTSYFVLKFSNTDKILRSKEGYPL